MTSDGMALDLAQRQHVPLRTLATAAAFTAAVAAQPSLVRRWSRKAVQSTPPPLPLISLPPDDEWEEFDVPVKTGFGYTLSHVDLDAEETHDESNSAANGHARDGIRSTPGKAHATHDRAAICRILSEYMAQNEAYQVRRHGFGIDTTLLYKRTKSTARKSGCGGSSAAGKSTETTTAASDELTFNAFFESGNLDRAYRVLGRHYATTQELLSNSTATVSAASASASASATPWSSPFPFFAKADMEYDLYCDTDISTHGHIQWYFFRVLVPAACFARSASPAAPSSSSSASVLRVRFNIRNMLKKASLYNDGMLPAVYVDGQHGRGWHHAGTNVCYFKNADTYRNRKSGKVSNFYTLSFVYDVQLPADVDPSPSSPPLSVYFAHCYPYTYTRLQRYLLQLQKDPERNRFFRRRVLCKTIAGNICDVLTITDFGHEDDDRSGVILTARVHPGESNSSFIMHGILDFLTGTSLEARYLRHRFVFKVVPMLNPDGVIHGNYRCSLAGTDLNRRYVDPSPKLHPTVFATKNMILSMRKTRPVSLYCDIHGHSRMKNMFLYGCLPYEENSRTEAAKLCLFPHVLSKTCGAGTGGCYSFQDGTFSVSKSKKGTGRVVVWDEAQVLNSFTLEASFFGVGVNRSKKSMAHGTATPPTAMNEQSRGRPEYNNPTGAGSRLDNALTHFMPNDLRGAGSSLCLSLIPFAHLLDRDRPSPPPPLPMPTDEPTSVRGFAMPPAASSAPRPLRSHDERDKPTAASRLSPRKAQSQGDSKIRLDPLPTSNVSPVSAPFLLPRSPSKKSVLPPTRGESPSRSPRSASSTSGPFSLFAADGFFSSLSSTEDLLREIEDTLPENYSQYGDSDDEGESAGSESDPSGDNMEEEELQRQDSWKNLIPEVAATAQEQTPKLTKNRSLTLLKRFSDSMLRLTLSPEDLHPSAPAPMMEPVRTDEPVKPTVPTRADESVRLKPAVTLAPVKTATPTPAFPVRRQPVGQLYPQAQQHLRDRNRDIASLHLRAVQRRTRSKRVSQRLVINEQELQ